MDGKPEIKNSGKDGLRVLLLVLVGLAALAGCRHIRVRVEIASPDASATETATPTAPSPSPTFTKPPESVRLTYDPAAHSQPALSPDGQTVVFISDRAGRPDIFRTSVTGGELINLTWTPAAQEDTPVFSPDGMTVAFASDRDGDWSIYLMDADGGNVRPALGGDTGTNEVHPAFTPDGKALVFSSNRADGNWDIYIAAIGSGEWTHLTTHPAVDRFPTVSADGETGRTRAIAFRSERDGNSEIYLMDADGSNLRRLTHHSAFDYYPSLTPDGRGLVFASNRSGKWNTYVTDLTSGEAIALEQRDGWEMDYPRLSSDGRWLVYAGGRTGSSLDIYLREFVNPFAWS
jgi:TolB protein